MLLDIAILPPAKLRGKLGKAISKATEGHSTVFVVDNKELIPHMSLFHLNVNKSKPPKESLLIRLSKTAEHIRLNKEIVQRCYGLRDGVMPWTSKRQPKKRELKNRRKYGKQHNIGKSFQPHLTLAYLKKPKDTIKLARKMRAIKFSFLADTVAITEVNFWHQVTRVIKTFKCKNV